MAKGRAKLAPAPLFYRVLIATGGVTLHYIKGKNVVKGKTMETCVGVWNSELEQAKAQSLTSLCGAVYYFFQLRIHCAECTNIEVLYQLRLCTVYPPKLLTHSDQPQH